MPSQQTPTAGESGEATGARLDTLLARVPGAVWSTDAQLRVTFAHGRLVAERRFRNAVGKTVQELLNTNDVTDMAIAQHFAALAGTPSTFDYDLDSATYSIHLEPMVENGERVGVVGVAIDITERRRAEMALRLSERRLAEAQRLAHVGSWEWAVAENRVQWSDELYAIYGVARADAPKSYEEFLERVVADDRDVTRAAILRALSDKGPFDYHHRVARPDGSIRMLHTRGSVVTEPDGQVIALVGSCWDVTDRWRATRQLEENVALLRATLESSADGILVVDLTGKVAAFNQSFLSMWRIPAALAEHRQDAELLQSVRRQLADPEGFLKSVEGWYARPEAEGSDVVRLTDGRVFERHTKPHRVAEKVVGRVWSFHDVTERERLLLAKDALLERAIFLSDCSRLLVSLDVDSALDAVARRSLGILGDSCFCDLYTVKGGPRRVAAAVRTPDEVQALPKSISTPISQVQLGHNGSRSWLVVPIPARTGILGEWMFMRAGTRDYTAADVELAQELAWRTALTLESARLFREANEALASRQEFVSIIAHELRGPLASLHLAVQTLQRKSVPEPAVPGVLDLIEREDRRIGRFVDELLELGRVQRGQFTFVLEPVDLTEVTSEVLARLGPDFAKKGSELSFQASANVRGVWDRSRLDQVVTNLVSNAIKYGEGKPIEVNVYEDQGRGVLMVKDHGIGIPVAQQESIFRPFERAVSSRRFGGLGLGLYIVRTIVQQLGGSVTLESVPGEGAEFRVVLPLQPSRGAESTSELATITH